MKLLTDWLIRLYPATWRQRYGEELKALVEDSSPGWLAVFDVFTGALRMQLKTPTFPALALVLSVAGLSTGLLVSFLVTPRYTSTAVLRLTRSEFRSSLLQWQSSALNRKSLADVMQEPELSLYPTERKNTPLEDVVESMRNDMRIAIVPGAPEKTSMFTVAFTYRDRALAQKTVQALIARLSEAQIDIVRASARQLSGRDSAGNAQLLEVLDPPGLPATPAWPNRVAFMATGFGAGVAFAVAVALFRRSRPATPLRA
jgi:uncharacterized protein involved in exopolysaccharide biosynthesis